ncbi:MAG: XrtA system polysaccharide chain length determinant [Gammaproteobacteria bacterium]
MDEILELAKIYLRMVWRHRWIALTCAFIVCLVGWIGVAMLPNKYESTAVIYIKKTSLLQPLLKDYEPRGAREAVAGEMAIMMRHATLIRPNLETLARAAGIDKTKTRPAEFDSAINRMKNSIIFTSTPDQQDVYSIVYDHSDPKLAHAVVQTLIDLFNETLIKAAQIASKNAQRFLKGQIKEYETKLQAAEQRLKVFKLTHVGLMPADGRTYYVRLEEAKNLYRSAILELNEVENSANSIRTQVNNFTTATSKPAPVYEQISAQQAKIAELQLKYTEKHPDLITAKNVLEELKKQATSESPNPASSSDNSLEYNPAYQELKLQLTKTEANAAALQTRVAEYKRRADALEQEIMTIPQVEAEFASLNRDYAVHKEKYQGLAEALERSALSNKAENIKVKVLEPPRVPNTPLMPDRIVFSAITFLIAVAFGVGIALALALSRPVIYTSRGLEKLVNIPVLGTVSYNAGTGGLKTYKPFVDLSFFFGISVLLVLYVTLNAMYLLKVDILMRLAGFSIVG